MKIRPGPLRTAAAAAALLAAAAAFGGARAERVRMVVVDSSLSVAGSKPSRGAGSGPLRPGEGGRPDREGLAWFAGNFVLDYPPSREPPVVARAGFARPHPGETDIAAALRGALALLPPEAEGEILLVTDGRATKGDTAAALAEARSRGVAVLAVPLEGGPLPARVAAVEAPARVRPGERIPVSVVVAGSPGEKTTVVLEDGAAGASESRECVVPPGGRGRIVFAREAGGPGVRIFRADAEGAWRGASRAEAAVLVEGEAAVLRLGSAPAGSGVAALLRSLSGGTEVGDAAGPAAVAALLDAVDLASTALLVLDDLPEAALPPGGGERIARAVEGGLGLVVLGGPRTLGAGGFAARPLEEALPVRCAAERPRPLVVLAIDASGSMEGAAAGGGSLAAEARTAAAALVERLPRDARLALVRFHDGLAAPTEIFDLASEEGRAAAAASALRVHRPGGGTRFAAAAAEAREAVARAPGPGVRVLLIVTDGRPSEDGGDLAGLGAALARDRFALRVVPVGPEADRAALGAFVEAAGGEVVAVGAGAGERSLADVLLAASGAADPSLWSPDPVAVRTGADPAPWGAAPSGLPPAAGRNRVWPRKGAALWLVGDDGSPLLAAARRGLGRSVVFAAPPEGGDAAWATAPAADLLAAAFRWAVRDPGAEGAEASAALLPDGGIAARLSASPSPAGEVRAGGVALRRTGLSSWEGTVPPSALDGEVLAFTAGEVLLARVAPARAPSTENAVLGTDAAALAALEVAGRGAAGRRGGANPAALSAGLLALALLLAAAAAEARAFGAPRAV